MRFLFKSSPAPLIIVAAFTAQIGNSAPTVEELLLTGPKAVVGPLQNNPGYNFTPWHLASFSGAAGKMSVTFKAEANIWSLASGGREFLLSEGFFRAWENNFGPTEKLIESTRPDAIEGGIWTFHFSYKDASYWSGDAHHVASWTWSQDPPSIPAPPPVVMVPRGVEAGLELNYAVARSLRRKDSKTASSLLLRQRKLLRQALSSAN
jgi:hypothetical protein